MLAKLIVWAPSRPAAIDRMQRALGDFVLLGVRTNLEFLRRIIATPDFASGNLDTAFLERHPELFNAPAAVPPEVLLIASLFDAQPGKSSATQPEHVHLTDVWNSGPWRNS